MLAPKSTIFGGYLLQNAGEVNRPQRHRVVESSAFQVVPKIRTTFYPIQKWLFLRRNVVEVVAGTQIGAKIRNKVTINGTQTFVLRSSGPSANFLDKLVDPWPI